MPFVKIIAGDLRDAAVEIERKARAGSEWDEAYRHGFFDALRAIYPSETVSMLVMDCDLLLDGDEPYTDCLPRLTVRRDDDDGV